MVRQEVLFFLTGDACGSLPAKGLGVVGTDVHFRPFWQGSDSEVSKGN